MEIIKTIKPSKKESVHYVNNKEFSQAVVDYATLVKSAKEKGTDVPRISEYIGRCFLRIAEGLSYKSNFNAYTYREEMVMDGVENCIKACLNYNPNAVTRSGLPNAFAYFTQIIYYAFLRRIMKEKKQQEIKMRYIEYSSANEFMTNSTDSSDLVYGSETVFIDVLKNRIDKVKTQDQKLKGFKKKVKEKTRLELFIKEV